MVTYTEGKSMRIYVSGNFSDHYIDCWCTRWDEGNWDLTVETFMSSGARNFLFNNTTPGAVRELYNILGTPEYIDTTYASGNTLKIAPKDGFGLSDLRETRTIAVKSISDSFWKDDIYNIKIEGKRVDI